MQGKLPKFRIIVRIAASPQSVCIFSCVFPATAAGGSHIGSQTDPRTSRLLLNAFADKGGNLIDAAHVYGAHSSGDESPSEKTIGQWLADRGCRDQIVLVTKGGHPDFDPKTHAFGKPRLAAEAIIHDLDISLRSLQTDYVDLYFLHRDDPSMPVEAIIDCLEEQVQAGKMRYYGCSNWAPARISEAAAYAAKCGAKGFVCNQVPANLAVFLPGFLMGSGMTCMDKAMEQYHMSSQLPVMTAMSLANGYFHKRLRQNGARTEGWPGVIYNLDVNDAIYAKLAELVQNGLPINSVLYAYLVNLPFPTVPLMGFSSLAQMEELLKDIEVPVPAEALAELRKIRENGAV